MYLTLVKPFIVPCFKRLASNATQSMLSLMTVAKHVLSEMYLSRWIKKHVQSANTVFIIPFIKDEASSQRLVCNGS